jgi:hypothetical protein
MAARVAGATAVRWATIGSLIAVVIAALTGCGKPSPGGRAISARSGSVNGWQLEGIGGTCLPTRSPSIRLILTRAVGRRPQTVRANVNLVMRCEDAHGQREVVSTIQRAVVFQMQARTSAYEAFVRDLVPGRPGPAPDVDVYLREGSYAIEVVCGLEDGTRLSIHGVPVLIGLPKG